jgi:hypothetical protein
MKRTDFEVCKSVFEVLFQNNPIHKSDLRGLTSLGPRSVNKWVDLIAFIQSQPKLKITRKGRYQMLELEKPPLDEKIDSETIEALRIMRSLIELPPDELKKRLDEISSHTKRMDEVPVQEERTEEISV